MRPPAPKVIAGRGLGWSASDLATLPYARFWNPEMADISADAHRAVANSPMAEGLFPAMAQGIGSIVDAEVQSGFTVTADGAIHVNLVTEMPDVTPAMIDWWFGWHSDSPERYKLWHPQAHVHAQWAQKPPSGAVGRSRYVGYTSQVDEYIGSAMIRGAIQFRPPEELGLVDAAVAGGVAATAVCARVGMVDLPIDIGYLAHHVAAVSGGSVMRSRFWMGGRYVSARGKASRVISPVAQRLVGLTELDARALLVHCSQEMTHLASFLPALYGQES
ncbi:MAG: DAPG hydrolase family protein [Mycobacterium sp.]